MKMELSEYKFSSGNRGGRPKTNGFKNMKMLLVCLEKEDWERIKAFPQITLEDCCLVRLPRGCQVSCSASRPCLYPCSSPPLNRRVQRF